MEKKVSNGKLNTRDRALDGAKGVAILIVMLGHCIVLNGLDQDDPIMYDAIASIQMPLFMLISGMAAAMAGLSFAKLKKRAVAYLVPFFSWFVISYFWARIRVCFWGASGEAVPAISVSGFFEELKGLLFQTDRGLWFLMTLFVVTCCMTVAVSCSRHFVVTLGCILVFYVLFFLQGRLGNTFLSPALTIKYMPFYVLGYLWQQIKGSGVLSRAETNVDENEEKKGRESSRVKKLLLTVYVICLIGFAFFVIRYPLTKPAENMKDFTLLMIASLLGTVAVFGIVYSLLSRFHDGKVIGFLSLIGTYTLEIYVLHFRFARLLQIEKKGLTLWSIPGILWCLAAFLLMSVLTALCIFILNKIPVCRFLLFGKKTKVVSGDGSF
ncbi:MAG: acyltransferase [Lachnospiraceae bacterium]|nr:acyltransferase [Lachnospiraceae bacterium]